MEEQEKNIAKEVMLVFRDFKRLQLNQSHIEGIRHSEFMLMLKLHEGQQIHKEGLKISELSKILSVTPPTVTVLTTQLENMKLIERVLDSSDRRVVRVRLTALGIEKLMGSEQSILKIFDDLVGYLGKDSSKELIHLLNKVRLFFLKLGTGNNEMSHNKE